MPITFKENVLSDFCLGMCSTRNAGGSWNLILRGNELINKIGRRLKDSDIVTIVQYLRNHQTIVTLDFAYNEITDCGVYTLCDFFLERPIIRHLNLIGNKITAPGAGFIASLKDRLSLFSLRLSGNKIGDQGAKELAKLLRYQSPLAYLDLSDTHLTMNGLAHLMTACMPSRRGNKMLKYIDFGRPLPQVYHEVHHSHAAEFLGQMIKDNDQLEEIHVQQYRFDFRDMEILLHGLLANKTLLCLDLNNNNIGDDGVGYLCQYLKTGPSLECLMIGANKVGDFGALALSAGLPYSKIKLLDITNNHINDEGIINILYTIKKRVAMRALFFWGNKVTHPSLVVLRRLFQTGLLKENHTDVSIYCADNKLHAARNYEANRYTHRYYCELNYESLKIKNLVPRPRPPSYKPPIYFKYHASNSELGFPMCEWAAVMPHHELFFLD